MLEGACMSWVPHLFSECQFFNLQCTYTFVDVDIVIKIEHAASVHSHFSCRQQPHVATSQNMAVPTQGPQSDRKAAISASLGPLCFLHKTCEHLDFYLAVFAHKAPGPRADKVLGLLLYCVQS